ncbi:MAG: hypothetical protein GVY28_00860 [Alphaproteobacteria bacterium]|jgi:adenine-specific DNA-methyltransferase|nr:hypothetical protein [Alphaproteobacteria bacterium]
MTASTVFIGGSRQVARLPAAALARLDTIVRRGLPVVVGDAAGADRAVQARLNEAGHAGVTVFCSGDRPRHNLGDWPIRTVAPPPGARGFQVHAAKDRDMAAAADVGLMIWDGRSPGTLLNVLRLMAADKRAVVIDTAADRILTLHGWSDWDALLASCPADVRAAIGKRATPEEAQMIEASGDLFQGVRTRRLSVAENERDAATASRQTAPYRP